jgi:antagonist of KipI
MSITIIKPGISSSIQDLGRWGHQRYGVPIGGAMDKASASHANSICGNDEHEAVIEMTLHGTSIMFNESTYCAIVGGGCRAYIDEIELPFNRLVHVPANSTMNTKADASGCRSYLAVAGGLNIIKEMGSASTYVPSHIGGVDGRNLKTDDIIEFKKNQLSIKPGSLIKLGKNIEVSQWEITGLQPLKDSPVAIQVLRGPEYDWFDERSQTNFFNTVFTITPQSNRIGYRLEGISLGLKEHIEMISTPVTSGIIQVDNQGNPIILMADAQTIGGYPRIARVCSSDIALLAQLRLGEKIRFRESEEDGNC